MEKYILIGIGAFLGANARYLMQSWAAARWGSGFPLGTVLVNVIGSFILGFFMTAATQRAAISTNWRLFISVGLLGGYTTFSSFTYETLALLQGDRWLASLLYFGGNVVIGLLAAFAGILLARAL
jgi:fluoride exporter